MNGVRRMMKFRKKPVVIEAREVIDDMYVIEDIAKWCLGSLQWDEDGDPRIIIQTLEGAMTAHIGDWVIKGVKEEFYPCKPDIFEATYEKVEDEANIS